MLRQRKKVQLLIFPKIFNVLSFYSKGQYTVHISVVQQSQDGKIVYAMPKIIESPTHKMNESKKSYIKNEKDKQEIAFVTEQFYVTYNQQCVALHDMAVFSLELDPISHKRTYIDFKLNLNRYKAEPNQLGNSSARASAGGSIQIQMSQSGNLNLPNNNNVVHKKRVIVEVDKRRIYLNNLIGLNQFKRIIFSQCQYFSFLDVYIGSCYLGTRFRLQKYQLSQFHRMEDKEKIQFNSACSQAKANMSANDQGALLSKQVGIPVQQFRTKFNSELDSSYVDLKRRIETLIKTFSEENHQNYQIQQIKKIISQDIHLQTVFKSKQQLQKHYKTQTTQQLFLQIYQQIVQFDNYLLFLWGIFMNLLHKISYKAFSTFTKAHLIKQNQQKQSNLTKNMKIDSDLRRVEHSNFLKRRKQVLDNLKLYQDDDIYHPFLMIEGFENKNNCDANAHEITSLVIFIHGYQGSDYDLQKAKNYLSVYNPQTFGLLIKSIQDEIDQNIEHLGERVAQEIKSHISGSVHSYRRISFVGYSLGGVIARQSIKHLSEYKDKMNLLVTFASPHLGVSATDNKLVSTGIWYLINFEKVKNLKQLNCQKIQNQQQQLTLKKLSDCQGLSWFKKLVLVSSQQDNFVPYHSSRISAETKNQNIQEMAKKILSRVKKVERVEVWFDVDHDIKTFDKILGRRAHIQFLENRIFLDMFFRLYGRQF